MRTTPFSPGKQLIMPLLTTLSILFVPLTFAAPVPVISGLPSAVTGIQSTPPFTGPLGPTYSTFTVNGAAAGSPLNAVSPNNVYNAWCWNPYGWIQTSAVAYTAYSSYDTTLYGLPGGANAIAWQEINWVLNNKQGYSGKLNPSVLNIQNVIWDLVVPGYTTDLSTDGQALLTNAQTYGPGFVPSPGQIMAITLYVGGINPNDSVTTHTNIAQDILIEYTLPGNPHINITKTANVSSARCSDQVTYTYTVTNTGNVTVTNVVVKDDNATPNYTADDFIVGTIASLASNASQTFTRTVYLPLTESGVDANGNQSTHTLITQILPNGNIQVTLLEDLNLVDNSYGANSSPDWGSQGNSPWSHLGADSAEFQFVDGNGNVVLDFAADYASLSNQAAMEVGTAGIWGGAGHLFAGDPSDIVSIDTTITDNFNQIARNSIPYFNSPPPGVSNWNFQCGYTVIIKPSCFGRNGYGGCNIKSIQHSKCKTGSSYKCTPTPICQTVTNTASVTAVSGTQTVTASAQASVVVSPNGSTTCQPQQCQCPCWNCQHGRHNQCQYQSCHDTQCKQQRCPEQQPRRPQGWWEQCRQQ